MKRPTYIKIVKVSTLIAWEVPTMMFDDKPESLISHFSEGGKKVAHAKTRSEVTDLIDQKELDFIFTECDVCD